MCGWLCTHAHWLSILCRLKCHDNTTQETLLHVCAEYYVAMYSYVSGEPTDLNFNEGDMIMVTKKDEDWWTGTLGDKTGIFPSSYVKKVEIQVSVHSLIDIPAT